MFVKRFISTIILLAIFSCIIFGNKLVSGISFMILGSVLSFFAPYEMCNILKQSGKPVFTKLVSTIVLISFLLLAGTFFLIDQNVLIPEFGFVFFLLIIAALPWFFLLFIIGKEKGLDRILNSCAVGFLFIPPFMMLESIYFMYGVNVFLFLILGTKIGDIGAYVVGTSTNKLMKSRGGNHKMIPSISPGKSWEGAVGGLIISVIFAVSLSGYAFPELDYGIWLFVLIGIFLFIFGAAGDLAESCIKRVCGVKDSGNTIPGIGGVFDLVDSLLLNSLLFGILFALILG